MYQCVLSQLHTIYVTLFYQPNKHYFPRLASTSAFLYVSHSKAPSQGVRDVKGPVISPNEISLMWIPPKRKNWNGILTTYTVGECNICYFQTKIQALSCLHLRQIVHDYNLP